MATGKIRGHTKLSYWEHWAIVDSDTYWDFMGASHLPSLQLIPPSSPDYELKEIDNRVRIKSSYKKIENWFHSDSPETQVVIDPKTLYALSITRLRGPKDSIEHLGNFMFNNKDVRLVSNRDIFWSIIRNLYVNKPKTYHIFCDFLIKHPDKALFLSIKGEHSCFDNVNYINKLLKCLHNHTSKILLTPIIWELIAYLRENILKGKASKESKEMYNSILDALKIDGRSIKHKNEDDWDNLKCMISNDLDFFLKIWQQTKGGTDQEEKQAIYDYLTNGVSGKVRNKREREYNSYENVYYEYKKIYKQITQKLSHNEAIYFLKIAAQNVNESDWVLKTYQDKDDDMRQEIYLMKEAQW